jgi:adenylate cyclase
MTDIKSYLAALQSIAHMLPAIEDLDDGLRRTLEVAVSAVDATGGSILFHEPAHRELAFRTVVGGTSSASHNAIGFGLMGVRIKDDEGIAGQVFQTGTPQIVNAVSDSVQHKKEIDEEYGYDTQSLATVPICFPGGAPIGVLQLLNKQTGDFTEEDLAVLDVIGAICAMSIALHQRGVSSLEPIG